MSVISMESDPEDDDKSDQDGLITQPKFRKSIRTLDENEDSDIAHEQSEDGDDEEDVSERDEELMNLDPKTFKKKIASEVWQFLN